MARARSSSRSPASLTSPSRLLRSGATGPGRLNGEGKRVVMDVHTGEVIVMTNVPEYDSNVMSLGKDVATIKGYLTSSRTPLLNRAVGGLFVPGSIVKPYVGLEALFEGGAKEVIIAATHPVFSGPAIDRLKACKATEVVITNSLPVPEEKRFDGLTVLSIAPLLARAIREVFEDGSEIGRAHV